MKKVLLLAIIVFAPSLLFSQTLKQNEIDEFTGETVLSTSWELLSSNWQGTAFFRWRSIEGQIFLGYKKMWDKLAAITVNQGERMMIKFDDGEILTIHSSKSMSID